MKCLIVYHWRPYLDFQTWLVADLFCSLCPFHVAQVVFTVRGGTGMFQRGWHLCPLCVIGKCVISRYFNSLCQFYTILIIYYYCWHPFFHRSGCVIWGQSFLSYFLVMELADVCQWQLLARLFYAHFCIWFDLVNPWAQCPC